MPDALQTVPPRREEGVRLCGWAAEPAVSEAETRLSAAEDSLAAWHLGGTAALSGVGGERSRRRERQRAASPRWERWLGPAAAERLLGDGGAAATRPEAPRAGKPGGLGTRRSPGTAGTPPSPPGELPLRILHTQGRLQFLPSVGTIPPAGSSRAAPQRGPALPSPRDTSTCLPRSGLTPLSSPPHRGTPLPLWALLAQCLSRCHPRLSSELPSPLAFNAPHPVLFPYPPVSSYSPSAAPLHP